MESNNKKYESPLSVSSQIDIDLTNSFDYQKLVREEIEEYSNIEVTDNLREGGVHAHKAWEYWFSFLQRSWQTRFGKEIKDFCNNRNHPKILSLGCGYGGVEIAIAKGLKQPYSMIAVDLNPMLFDAAIEETKASNLNIQFEEADLNFIKLKKNSFDLVFAHASLHHVLNLENLCEQIYTGLKNDGRLVILDIIGKTQVLFWEENVNFAIELVASMPKKYKVGVDDYKTIIPPYQEPAIQVGMEGIRQEEIESQISRWFSPLKVFKYGAFMRLICTHPILGKNINPDVPEDLKYLDYLCNLDLEQVKEQKLRPTEIFAVYKKNPRLWTFLNRFFVRAKWPA
jgi:SAM-dependent methyltransferase